MGAAGRNEGAPAQLQVMLQLDAGVTSAVGPDAVCQTNQDRSRTRVSVGIRLENDCVITHTATLCGATLHTQ